MSLRSYFRSLFAREPGNDEQLRRLGVLAARRYDEPGNDEQYERRGLWELVLARAAADRQREREEDERTRLRARHPGG